MNIILNELLMRVLLLVSLICVLLLPRLGFTQEKPDHRLKLSAGFNDYAGKDRLVSPFVYSGTRNSIYLGYDVYSSDFKRTFEIGYSGGTVDTRTPTRHETYSGFMRFNYLRRVGRLFNDIDIYAGGRLSLETHVEQATFYGLNNSYVSNPSGFVAPVLGGVAHANYTLGGKHTFSFEPNISLLGWVIRPGYSLYHESSFIEALKKARLSSYGRFLNLTTRLTYRLSLADRINVSLNYDMDYTRYTEPFEIRLLNHSLLMGVGVEL